MKRIICMLLMLCLIVSTLCCCAKAPETNTELTETSAETFLELEPELNLAQAGANLKLAGYDVYYTDQGWAVSSYCDAYVIVATEDPYIQVLVLYICASNAAIEDLYQETVNTHITNLESARQSLTLAETYCLGNNWDSWSVAYLQECKARLSAYESMVIGYKDNIVWIGTPEAIEDSRG